MMILSHYYHYTVIMPLLSIPRKHNTNIDNCYLFLTSIALVASGEKATRTQKMSRLIGQPYIFYIFKKFRRARTCAWHFMSLSDFFS
jgi:hypothetical protein